MLTSLQTALKTKWQIAFVGGIDKGSFFCVCIVVAPDKVIFSDNFLSFSDQNICYITLLE